MAARIGETRDEIEVTSISGHRGTSCGKCACGMSHGIARAIYIRSGERADRRAGSSPAVPGQLAERMGLLNPPSHGSSPAGNWSSRETLLRYALATGSSLRVSLVPAE